MKTIRKNYDISIKFSKTNRYKVDLGTPNERSHRKLSMDIEIKSCHQVCDKLDANNRLDTIIAFLWLL